MSMPKEGYITIPQLAKRLGLSRIAIYKRVKKGEIPATKIGRMYVITDQTINPDHSQALYCGAVSADTGSVIFARRSSTYLFDTPAGVSLVFLAIIGISGTSLRGS